MLSETWASPSWLLNESHFRTYRSDHPDGYDGMAILIHNFLKSKLISIDTFPKNVFINHKTDIIGIDILTSDSLLPLKA